MSSVTLYVVCGMLLSVQWVVWTLCYTLVWVAFFGGAVWAGVGRVLFAIGCVACSHKTVPAKLRELQRRLFICCGARFAVWVVLLTALWCWYALDAHLDVGSRVGAMLCAAALMFLDGCAVGTMASLDLCVGGAAVVADVVGEVLEDDARERIATRLSQVVHAAFVCMPLVALGAFEVHVAIQDPDVGDPARKAAAPVAVVVGTFAFSTIGICTLASRMSRTADADLAASLINDTPLEESDSLPSDGAGARMVRGVRELVRNVPLFACNTLIALEVAAEDTVVAVLLPMAALRLQFLGNGDVPAALLWTACIVAGCKLSSWIGSVVGFRLWGALGKSGYWTRFVAVALSLAVQALVVISELLYEDRMCHTWGCATAFCGASCVAFFGLGLARPGLEQVQADLLDGVCQEDDVLAVSLAGVEMVTALHFCSAAVALQLASREAALLGVGAMLGVNAVVQVVVGAALVTRARHRALAGNQGFDDAFDDASVHTSRGVSRATSELQPSARARSRSPGNVTPRIYLSPRFGGDAALSPRVNAGFQDA